METPFRTFLRYDNKIAPEKCDGRKRSACRLLRSRSTDRSVIGGPKQALEQHDLAQLV
jgi:hypothetical protein